MPAGVPIDAAFYARPAPDVAGDLLGKLFVLGPCAGRIVEVEAYLGADDPASHSYRGQTARNQVMFGPAGHLYVYFTYGMHWCANVVTGAAGVGEAVLLRAVEPVAGIELMSSRRGGRTGRALCSGPAKLCQAFGIDRRFDGAELVPSAHGPWLVDDGAVVDTWHTTRRIGLSVGIELPLRYVVTGSRFASRSSSPPEPTSPPEPAAAPTSAPEPERDRKPESANRRRRRPRSPR